MMAWRWPKSAFIHVLEISRSNCLPKRNEVIHVLCDRRADQTMSSVGFMRYYTTITQIGASLKRHQVALFISFLSCVSGPFHYTSRWIAITRALWNNTLPKESMQTVINASRLRIPHLLCKCQQASSTLTHTKDGWTHRFQTCKRLTWILLNTKPSHWVWHKGHWNVNVILQPNEIS